MGNKKSITKNSSNIIEADKKASSQPKVLCLHGWRTSGDILSFQMGAFRFHVGIDCEFLDAPHEAVGAPDPGIAMYYPDEKYYEWFYRVEDEENGKFIFSLQKHEGLDESLEVIAKYISEHGPFDGILGFSQGASMATRVIILQQLKDPRFLTTGKIKFGILIGGVPPLEYSNMENEINIPSLHIIGNKDEVKPRSEKLLSLFHDQQRTVLYHEEGHNIPSIKTEIYPIVKSWIYSRQ